MPMHNPCARTQTIFRFPPSLRAGFWMLLILNSGMAYFVNLTNFLVTKYTSALTLQVGGEGDPQWPTAAWYWG